TGHLAHKDVAAALTQELVSESIQAANKLRKLLPKKQRDKPLALLGLNPHAGEEGIIGVEENDVLIPALKDARRHKIPIQGPLVPDAAFFKENWNQYSVFVCPYHDQGLIPFKMIHGQDSGVHVTMGLPFVRTSVDHGTAKNIFGKNRANPSSMIEAIKWAIMLAKQGEGKGSA
ncbi:MAG: 4-hydroxythreonine-4-phosphate dehydrogenase PdxA, partial [Bdellovibrionales bacterium]|nr:4-hydroxythreonine-4-phosphate dehydrogenase PdxA [Bdellovibrionales bacterium]